MENQDLFPFLLTFLFIVIAYMLWRKSRSSSDNSSNLPPGPWKFPLIGNLNLFVGTVAHHRFSDLAKKFGPIMHLQLGQVPYIVISSPEAAREVMKVNDLSLADRPQFHSAKFITYNFKDIAFSSYGDYWRQLKKICMLELLSQRRVQSFRSIREEEMRNVVGDITSKAGSVINLREILFSSGLAIMSRAAFGGICKHREEFKHLIPEIVTAFGGLSVADLFPSIKLFQMILEMRPKFKKMHQKLDEILENIIMEHRAEKAIERTGEAEPDDLVYVLLNLQDNGELELPLTTTNIKAIILDVFTGGGESSSTIIEWAMSEMLKNPRIMEKAQAEVRHVFASKGYVEEAGIHELKYLSLVMKETLRFHPSLPLLVPRESREPVKISGYEIPAKYRVIVNAWAIGRDPQCWPEAETFCPERFLDCAIDYKGLNFEFTPFGSGRRMCPGISFSMATIEITLANLLFHFDWKLPGGKTPEDLDMTEVFSNVARRKDELCLVPIPYHPTP
ncbi:hypothetical protein SLEP1_g44329 [Rubroshorea leprosula]|uniref:Cytochrome P450 n=1 Tax=Rubroshorea leprosula TaxID=152421 RepID=A0AAV5LGL0_9ROSI|nr:hypothetical protein SLEP1_g44329 [Rubroshorea leprosula]